jgi:cytoskeletal protein CcmA (bactofilin family)
MQVEGEITVIGSGARLEGTVVSAGSLRIDGTVKGQINADGDVILSPQSKVEADIRAENVSISGRLLGNIIAKGKAELGRGGRIEGDVTSRVLVVHEGAVFSGQSIMDQQAQRVLQGEQAQPPKAQAPGAPVAPTQGQTSPQAAPPAEKTGERARVP